MEAVALLILYKIIRGQSYGCNTVYSLETSHIEGDETAVVYNTEIGVLQEFSLSSLISLSKTEKVLGIDLSKSSVIKVRPIELYLRQREAVDKICGITSHYLFKGGHIFLESCNLGSNKLYRVLEGTAYIEKEAFSKNTSTQFAVKLPKSCIVVGLSCFRGSSITSINLENVRSIGARAFSDCKYLKSVTLDNCNMQVCAFEAAGIERLVIKNTNELSQNCFSDCKALVDIDLGQVCRIKSGAFQGCESLKEIYLPIKNTEIDSRAFAECSSLETINIENISLSKGIGVGAFSATHLSKEVYSALEERFPSYYFFNMIYAKN